MRALLLSVILSACSHPMTATSGPVAAPGSASKTIVLIHGMFMTPHCWDSWVTYLQARGFTVIAPAWPLHEGDPATLRARHPDPALGKLTLNEVVDYYAKLIAALPEKPVLIGHSMGGLIVQLLLQKQLATAGVAIDSAPPKGLISLKLSFLKANWPVIAPGAKKDEPHLLTQEEFAYAFTNTLAPEAQRSAYARDVVPESRRVGNDPTTPAGAIDFTRPRPPLLLIAGSEDNIIPASLNWDNFGRYATTPAFTEFHEFAGRSHYTLQQEGWQSVADTVIAWIAKQ